MDQASNQIVIAFDLYGTLLSTESISKHLAELVGSKAKASQIAATWRKYQLEYIWKLNSMGLFDTFENVTRNSLVHALSESQVELQEEKIAQLIGQYDHLNAFPDVKDGIEVLSERANITAIIFSNGTQEMISNSLIHSQDLSPSPHATVFQQIITTDAVQKHKPAPETYQHLAQTTRTKEENIWLVSANPFDIVGATKMGLKTAWVDRSGRGWEDRVILALRPKIIGRNIKEIIESILLAK